MKQLASWLNATDKDTGPADSSMTGLVFMLLIEINAVHHQGAMGNVSNGDLYSESENLA